MLSVKAGSWRMSATLIFPDNNSTRYQHVGHYPKYDGKDVAKLIWAAVSESRLSNFSFVGSAEILNESSLARGAEVDIARPLLTLRIPLSGKAVLRVFREMAEIEDMKPKFDLFKPGSGPEPSENSVSYVKRLIEAAYDDAPRFKLPSPTKHITPLDWTFELLLRAYPAYKCPNPERSNQGETRRLTTAVIDDPNSDERKSVTDVVLALPHFGKDLLLKSPDLSISAVLVGGAFKRMSKNQPHFTELLATGIADPVFLNVIDCIVQRELLAGEDYPLGHVIHRSQYYRAASDLIAKHFESPPFESPPLFFTAAHQVTRLIGVGAIDVIEELPGTFHALSTDEEMRNTVWQKFSENSDYFGLKVGDKPPVLPNRDARTLLRDINRTLFDRNRSILRQLLSRRGGGLFDPLQQIEITTAKDFDLRMVLFEQGIVEKEIVGDRQSPAGNQQPKLMDDDKLDKALAEAVFAVRPLSDGHDSQWLSQEVVGLLETLDLESSKERFGHFKRDSEYIFSERASCKTSEAAGFRG